MRSKLEIIRTVAAVVSDVMAVLSVLIQLYGLHFIMTHQR